jgi:hypothetical protein
MLKILSVPAALSTLLISGAAYAEYDTSYQLDAYAQAAYAQRDWSIFDHSSLLVAVALAAFVSIGMAFDGVFGGGRNSSRTSASSTDTAEHYEQEAYRLRAWARKLDAEGVAADSQIRAVLKGDELKEIKKLIDDDKPRRGR